MLQAPFSQVEMRTIRMGFVTPAALPSVVAASARGNVIFATVSVPATEMWLVSWGGGVVEVDDPRLQLVSMSVQLESLSNIIPEVLVGANFPPGPVGGLTCFVSGTGTRYFFSISLQGMVFFPNDVFVLTGQVLNTDAGAAHSIVNTLSSVLRVQPVRLGTEIAVSALPMQQIDANLAARLRAGTR